MTAYSGASCVRTKKTRGRDPRQSGDTSWPTVVADCSHIADYGEGHGSLRGALVSPQVGFTDRGGPAGAVCFSFANITRCVAPVGVRGHVALSEKMRKSKTTEEQLFFFPLLLLHFVCAKKRARASHPALVHEVDFRSCEPLPGSN